LPVALGLVPSHDRFKDQPARHVGGGSSFEAGKLFNVGPKVFIDPQHFRIHLMISVYLIGTKRPPKTFGGLVQQWVSHCGKSLLVFNGAHGAVCHRNPLKLRVSVTTVWVMPA
jgi:hypothetical protein